MIARTVLKLIHSLGWEESLKRLEGTPPQGHHRRLDRGHAEREPEQGGDTDSATASPIGGQGTGSLERRIEYWRRQAAAMMEESERCAEGCGRIKLGLYYKDAAGVYESCARQLSRDLGLPRPQSGEDGDDPKAALIWALGLIHREAVRLEELADKYGKEGDEGRMAYFEDLTAESQKHWAALHTLLPQESREERSVPPIVPDVERREPAPLPSDG